MDIFALLHKSWPCELRGFALCERQAILIAMKISTLEWIQELYR